MSLTVHPASDPTNSFELAESVWRLVPFFNSMVEDLGMPENELMVPTVQPNTLAWLKFVASQCPLPNSWSKRDFEQLCATGLSAELALALDGRRTETLGVLTDLDFLGGGFFYDVCRVFVAGRITRENWSVDRIKETFGIAEGVQ